MNPLDQLNDISLPETIHNYPIAMGWWILAALIILVIVITCIHTIKRYKKAKDKRIALKRISEKELTTEETIKLLKWASLQYFPRHQVASLYGEQFKNFLINTLPEKKRNTYQDALDKTFQDLYSEINTPPNKEFSEAAKAWLSEALPPTSTTIDRVQSIDVSSGGSHD